MPHRRTLTAIFAAAVMLLVPPVPARAHGAPEDPVSRTLACAPGGPYEQSEVCQAALAASDRAAFEDWDYLRVAGVGGQDREVIPDGELCSGGVSQFAGLDLARADWPTTELAAGAEITFTYRTTIPHQGIFRLYVTTDGYHPTAPLAWSDLEPDPFLTVTDPEIVDDAYQLPGKLPGDKSGRHLIYTIWENTDTPDTYYSCSDVIFGSAPTIGPTATGSPSTDSPPVEDRSDAGPPAVARTSTDLQSPWVLGGIAVLLVVVALAVMLRFRRPGRRHAHRRHR